MPVYSFGKNSILKIEITEEKAAAYNRWTQAFFDAQKKLRDAGTPWEPTEPIYIVCTEEDMRIYNEVGAVINEAISKIDQEKTPIEIEDDFLVKN